jgi:hypothetical protein
LANLVQIDHVHLQGQSPSPACFDRFDDIRTLSAITKAECNVSTGLGEGDGDRSPKTTGSAGYQRDLTF